MTHQPGEMLDPPYDSVNGSGSAFLTELDGVHRVVKSVKNLPQLGLDVRLKVIERVTRCAEHGAIVEIGTFTLTASVTLAGLPDNFFVRRNF